MSHSLLNSLIFSCLGTELSSKIFEILYATAEGFQPAQDVVPTDDAVMEPSLEAEQEEDETY